MILSGASEGQMMERNVENLWTIVGDVENEFDATTGIQHIEPYDENLHDDQGMLVFFSEEAAIESARLQQSKWGGNIRPMRLLEYLSSKDRIDPS